MELRVNLNTMINQALASTSQQTAQLAQLQAEASTGNQLLEPSDGPAQTVALLAAQGQNAQLGSYLSNIQSATSTLNAGVTAMQQADNIITQAQQIALQGSQSGNSQQALDTLADQVNQLLNQLLATANTQNGNQYLFSGADPQTQPFVVSSTNSQGQPETITYQGSSIPSDVIVGPNQTVQTLYPGSQVFQSIQPGQPAVFQGSTGAAPGQGTDSATGQGILEVQHTSTTYAAGSGVAAGTSSPAGDTILGPPGAHTLTVVDTSGNGSAGTVSLDGGPAVAFTSSDTNLQVTGPGGEVVYVDTSHITAGFNGTVAITTTGTLSVDGGKTTVPITYTSNQEVTNGTTGAVTNVDSTGISSTGNEQVEYPGTYDAFQALIALRDDLLNTTAKNASQQIAAIGSTIPELARIGNSVLTNVGQQSASLQYLQGQQTSFQALQLSAQQLTTNLQSADIPTVIVQLQEQQNQLQLTLASTAQILQQTNLLDFLK